MSNFGLAWFLVPIVIGIGLDLLLSIVKFKR